MPNSVTVVGSINVDNTLHIKKLPKPGETIAMTAFSKAAGGKGANQAVAAARSTAITYFVGQIGSDDNGQFMLNQLQANGIDTDAISVIQGSTGQAYILLQESGQNSIIVQAGANGKLDASKVVTAKQTIQTSNFVVTQLETPIDAAIEAFRLAHTAGNSTILNPAPAQKSLPKELLQETDLIVPNETESALITGIPTDTQQQLEKNAEFYHRLGISNVIITLGSEGSYISSASFTGTIPAFKVPVTDTTAAGDTYIGALVSELEPGFKNIEAAATYASRASSLTVQNYGALDSIPTRNEITEALNS